MRRKCCHRRDCKFGLPRARRHWHIGRSGCRSPMAIACQPWAAFGLRAVELSHRCCYRRPAWPAGGVAERSIAAVLKTVEGASLPGVRIPPPPPSVCPSIETRIEKLMCRCSIPHFIPLSLICSGSCAILSQLHPAPKTATSSNKTRRQAMSMDEKGQFSC